MLLIEDDSATAQSIELMLKSENFNIYTTDLGEEGVDLGKVSHLFATGANDVLVVCGERERLIPFVTGQFVKEVDLKAGRITVDWDADF